MKTKKITVSEQTGITAYEIAGHILKENKIINPIEQLRCKIEEWIIENNGNNYRFAKGSKIDVLEGKREIAKYANDTFCACDDGTSCTSCQCGWKLTITGKLVRGETGWLVDENCLYILKDGRRLNKEQLKKENAELRIGDNNALKGLEEILNISSEEVKKDVDIYNVVKLIRDYGHQMSTVVYQAFQTSIGYKMSGSSKDTIINKSKMWIPCTWNTPAGGAFFGVIGRDETDIPIIATRVGRSDAPKKLVIAGPHGDERNAQRLIMTAQKHFLQYGVPTDTVMYFIPCISPTMAFADARGIPNEFWEGGTYGTAMANGPFRLKTINIPALHDKMDAVMRKNIQENNESPLNPRYGVDANRDFYFSLPSSRAFLSFIENKIVRPLSNNLQTTTETVIEGRTFSNTTYNNIRVLMMHGYDRSGAVYGPYSVYKKSTNEPWPARMDEKIDIYHVNELMRKYLGMWDFDQRRTDPLYLNTSKDARPYQGEWSLHLYNRKIWSMDIELPDSHARGNNNPETPSYNEGVRGITEGSLKYKTQLIESKTLPYFNENNNGFYKLLSEYPWKV